MARSLAPTVILTPPSRGKNPSLIKQQFSSAINSDLDIPAALALVWKTLKEKTIDQKTLLEFDEVLGLEIKKHLKEKKEKLPGAVEKIINARDLARAAKNFAESDRLRRELEAQGYTVEDTKDGTRVTKK